MEVLLFVILLKIILNEDIHDITSFNSYRIQENQNDIIFRYNYQSDEKADIIIYLTPYSDMKIVGEMVISNNIDLIQSNENIESKKIIPLNNGHKFAIVINTNEAINIGKGNYYINLVGNILCDIEIFLSNEIRDLSIEKSYYFPYIKESTNNFISFRINQLNKDITLNILKENKGCEYVEIYEDNEKMECANQMPEYVDLKKNKIYLIKIIYDKYDDIAINFVNNVINDINNYNNNLIPLDDSEFYFIMNMRRMNLNEKRSIEVDYDSNIRFSIFYLEEDISDRNQIPNKKNLAFIDHKIINNENTIILQRTNEKFKYALIFIYIEESTNFPLKINVYNNILSIENFPFNFNIKKNNSYFFEFKEEIKTLHKFLDNYIIFKFNYTNIMKIYTKNTKNVFKNDIFAEKIKNIISICFSNSTYEGYFQVFSLPYEYNSIFNLELNSKLFYQNFEDKNKFLALIMSNHETVIYFKLILGNSSFSISENLNSNYDANDIISFINQKKVESNTNELFKLINNKNALIQLMINSYSIFDYYIQQEEDLYINIYSNSKIKFLKQKIRYRITFEDQKKKLLKLLTKNKEVKIYKNENINAIKYLLNNEKQIIYLNENDTFIIEGNNCIIGIYFPLTDKENYLICDKQSQNYKNIEKIFITPNESNYDALNIIFTFDKQNDENDIYLDYLIDYHIIPYSRKNMNYERRYFNNKEKLSLLIPNIYKEKMILSKDNNEKFFIFIRFSETINSLKVDINYINYYFINNNEYRILPPGYKKIFLGYESSNYINLDLCKNSYISYSFIQNDEIASKNNTINSNQIINLYNENENDYYSMDINSNEEILLSLTNKEIENLDLNYNYSIDIEMINGTNNNIIVYFESISESLEIEYTIYILDSKYKENLDDHCFIQYLINNNIYSYKKVIYSNGKTLNFKEKLNLENIIEGGKEYYLIIVAKELINFYPQYKYYSPSKFISNSNAKESKVNSSNILFGKFSIICYIILFLSAFC